MALNIKNAHVEALQERKWRLIASRGPSRKEGLQNWLQSEVWPDIPAEALGKPISKEQEEAILGYGAGGF